MSLLALPRVEEGNEGGSIRLATALAEEMLARGSGIAMCAGRGMPFNIDRRAIVCASPSGVLNPSSSFKIRSAVLRGAGRLGCDARSCS